MVALTGTVVTLSTAAANGVLASGAAVGLTTGAAVGIINSASTTGTTGAIVCKSIGGGAVLGAVGGSITMGTAGAAVMGATTSMGTAAAINSAIAGIAGLTSSTAVNLLSGPVGWLVLGATQTELTDVYTFDCWKQILHDDSYDTSHGKVLKEVVMDPRIKDVTTTINVNDVNLPHLILQNIWNEQFLIEYVSMPFGQLAAHAVKI